VIFKAIAIGYAAQPEQATMMPGGSFVVSRQGSHTGRRMISGVVAHDVITIELLNSGLYRMDTNVQALAKQLRARIKVEDAEPGSAVSVVHTHLAAVNDEAGDLPA